MKKVRTQHGIAVDFCYPDSEELSLICPESELTLSAFFRQKSPMEIEALEG